MNNEDDTKYEFLLERLEKQQDNFFERSRNTDVKLGIMIALISAILVYILPNMLLSKINVYNWINDYGIFTLILIILLDISIITLLLINVSFALIALKTKKAEGPAPAMFGEEKLNKSKADIQTNAIKNYESMLKNNLKKEEKKNNKLDVCIILTLISIFAIVLERIICILIF